MCVCMYMHYINKLIFMLIYNYVYFLYRILYSDFFLEGRRYSQYKLLLKPFTIGKKKKKFVFSFLYSSSPLKILVSPTYIQRLVIGCDLEIQSLISSQRKIHFIIYISICLKFFTNGGVRMCPGIRVQEDFRTSILSINPFGHSKYM